MMSKEMLAIPVILFLIAIGIGIRLRPLWINPSLGVDHWYWLLCAEDVKRRRKLPPRLPYFMLEIEEQWYPPLFSGLLALLSMRWLRDHGGKLSQLIDLSQGLMISLTVLWFSNSLSIAFLSGLSYLIAWFPMTYNTQLQPRGLANLFLTLAMGGLCFYIETNSFNMWIGVLVISVILLFLHKMTVQMWIVYLLGFGFWVWDWKIFLLIPASVFLALVISRGFYIKMLKAHWDIISFWAENIQHFGKHQYYDSPLYQKKDRFPKNWRNTDFGRTMIRIIQIPLNNVFVILLPILIFQAVVHPQGQLRSFLWFWLGITYLWSFLTTLLPYFKALGAGSYYVYHAFLPFFALVSLYLPSMSVHLQWWSYTLWGIALAYSAMRWERYCRSIPNQKTTAIGDDLKEVLHYLKGLPKDGVFCIPVYLLPDGTAYWTRKRVFWGGHSYGFHTMLKPLYPIVREDVRETLKKKPLNYLLFWKRYLLSLKDIGLEEGKHLRYLFGKGEYELYEIIK